MPRGRDLHTAASCQLYSAVADRERCLTGAIPRHPETAAHAHAEGVGRDERRDAERRGGPLDYARADLRVVAVPRPASGVQRRRPGHLVELLGAARLAVTDAAVDLGERLAAALVAQRVSRRRLR